MDEELLKRINEAKTNVWCKIYNNKKYKSFEIKWKMDDTYCWVLGSSFDDITSKTVYKTADAAKRNLIKYLEGEGE